MLASRLSRILGQISKESVIDPKGNPIAYAAQCKKCANIYKWKTGGGTGTISRHYETCYGNDTISASQTQINFAGGSTGSSMGQTSLTRRRYAGGSFTQYVHSLKNRPFSTTTIDKVHEEGSEQKERISVTFVNKDGEESLIKVPVGMSMLEAAHENDIELEGACEGSLACSTCHVIVMDMEYYNKLEEPTDEENDMLDLAFGLTETSRLGCQIVAKPELDGLRLALPAATRNFAVDGFVPKPH